MAYDPTKPVWEQVTLDPELRGFAVLSPADVSRLTIEAMQKPDPAAWLSETIANRAMEKKKAIEGHYEQRKKDDAARILNVHRWPSTTTLCMKEQPWVKANGRRFGHMARVNVVKGDWVVYPDGEDEERFGSLEELVEVWSVD